MDHTKPRSDGHVTRRAATEDDSPFPAALADTEPDTWGKRVIQRAHAKRSRGQRRAVFRYLRAVEASRVFGRSRYKTGRSRIGLP